MPDPFWGNLQKSVTDSELIEAAIARISQIYSSMLAFGTWGMVPKSQSNPDTIDDQIDADIIAHNADESAHLAAGQSLQSHKAAEIIDHLARSVVRDKLIFDRFTIDEHFATIDAWVKSAGVYLDQISQMSLTTSGGSGDVQYTYIQPGDSMSSGGIAGCSPIWQVRAKASAATAQTIYIIQGDPNIPAGFGFKIVNGNLYKVYWDGDSVEQTEQITGVTVTDWHNYRIEYFSGVSVKWYVDDVLKKTMLTNLPTGFQMFIYLQITADAAATKILYIQNFHYDEDYSS